MENKNFFFKNGIWGYFLILLIPLLGCDNSTLIPVAESDNTYEISEYDAQPIIKIQDDEFIGSEILEQYRKDLASHYGERLLETITDHRHKMTSSNLYEPNLMLIKDLRLKQKVTDQLSTHIRVINDDGDSEEFLLGLRSYTPNITDYQKKVNTSESEDIWIALDPDRFYLDDDENGEEIWPITFLASHITDDSRSLEVVFNQNGLVSATEVGKTKQAVISDPDLLFLETVIVLPCDPPMLKTMSSDCGGSYNPPPPPPQRINDNGRGGSTGTGTGTNTYVVLKNIRLASTGDGSGSSELQMFVKNSDNDLYNLPVSYQYRFDAAFRSHPYSDNIYVNTMIKGADKGGFANIYYEVPDINSDGVNYSFEGTTKYFSPVGSGPFLTSEVDYFPLFNLTKTEGPWRFVLSDDDKDYADMSKRRHNSSYFLEDINTLDMSTGIWNLTETGFTTKSHHWGSSDDPLIESGVRRITRSNMDEIVDASYLFSSTKWYGNNSFNYVLGLETYSSY